MMGTKFVEERTAAGLFNCWRGDTKVLTRNGYKRIDSLSDTDQELMVSTGAWVKAPIRNFGKQNLYEVKLKHQNGYEKSMFSTSDHRWFAREDYDSNVEEFLTKDLKEGSYLQLVFGQGNKTTIPSPQGIQAGIVYGDGTLNQGRGRVVLCGDKNEVLAKNFPLNTQNSYEYISDEGSIIVDGLPAYYKDAPPTTEMRPYLYGWLMGYFAADGTVEKNGQAIMSSTNKKSLEIFKDVAAICGIGTLPIRSEFRISNLTGEESVLYKMTILREKLTDEFFLIDSHRERWSNGPNNPKRSRTWKVVSVSKTDIIEDVYCATVEGYGNFVVEDHILSGNCAFRSTEDIEQKGGYLFGWMMDALMVGIGVGFDTKGAGKIEIKKPVFTDDVFFVSDDREGWVESVIILLDGYFWGREVPKFDYSLVRPYGSQIKGFGGTASGSEPLETLHSEIKELFEARLASGDPTITSVDIVDTENLIGKCVVAGNVRRSAALALGGHDDMDYLTMKNDEEKLRNHRWGSNNSFHAIVGQDYTWHAEQSQKNGEPGYIWLDNARTRGRFKDGYRDDDLKVAGFNPCVTADTWVDTSNGPQQVSELIGKEFVAIVDGKEYKTLSNGFWETGYKPVYELATKQGFTVRATDNHKFLTENKGWVELGDLKNGDQLVINNHRGYKWDSEPETLESNQAYTLGLVVGDGTIKSDGQVVVSVWEEEDGSHVPLMERVACSIQDMPKRSDFAGWSHVEGRLENRLRLKALSDFAAKYEMSSDKRITESIERQNTKFTSSFLRGLFDADGSVQGGQEKGVSIRLSQSDEKRLLTVQRMLLRFGIYSKIYWNRRPQQKTLLPDGNGGHSYYDTKANHELVISCDNLQMFMDKIGFEHIAKRNKLEILLGSYKRSPNKTNFTATVSSINLVGKEAVYDVTVEEVHAFSANGIMAHNCVEQQLESSELCCLVETFPAKHDSYEDYLKTLKVAYMYGKTVTLANTHWPETNAIMLKNRRIGLSQSGVVQAFHKFGRRKMLNWCDNAYDYVTDLDKEYSDWMCIPRSVRMTSIKPSGTVSLLNGSTPGIHYPEDEFYIRRIRFAKDHALVGILSNAGYHIEDCVYSPNTKVASFPVKEEFFIKGKREVSMWEQLEIAAQYQHYWADNSVSVTVTFKPDEADQIKTALEMYESRLKAVSFLRYEETGYEQAPYESITEQEFNEMSKSISPIDTSSLTEQGAGTKFCDGEYCVI